MKRILPLLLVTTLALGACTTNKKTDGQPTDVPSETVVLDPMLVRPSGDGPTEAIDVNELFDRAYKSFSNRQYEEASKDYETIIRYFPDSRFYLPSLYNAGLAYEKLERWSDAVRVYRAIVKGFPEKEDTTDAYYRLAGALEQTGEWEAVVELMTQVMLRDGITTFDRVEAHVRRSNALLQLGNWTEAADGFRNALAINERAPAEDRVAENSHFIVQSYFGIGRAYHHRVSEIRLVLPPERMGEDLKKKAELFMTSQANYIRALAFHHPQWSMAAGFMIGRLYEDFYRDIFAAEIPEDLSEQHLALYFEELRKQIRPLMERAVQVYEKNLSLSKRIMRDPEENEWIRETSTHLERLKAYLNDPATQRRAERFVVAGRDLELMWEPVGIAQDEIFVALRAAKSESDPRPEPKAEDAGEEGTTSAETDERSE
jgi:tetratricopeptide (TPR) repeat protein